MALQYGSIQRVLSTIVREGLRQIRDKGAHLAWEGHPLSMFVASACDSNGPAGVQEQVVQRPNVQTIPGGVDVTLYCIE